MRHKIPLIGVFFLLSFVYTFVPLSIPSQVARDSPRSYGDAIVVGSIGDARTLIPILASDSSSGEICSLIYNGLVKYDKDLHLIGDLSENWEVKENGLLIIFHLRRNVIWHDGKPFSARDVEFTFKKLTDPNVKTPYSGDFLMVKELRVIDDYTVSVRYREPFAPGLASWGMPIMSEHSLKNEDLNNTKLSREPIGTGPYVFKAWKTAEKIELVLNPDYFEGRPFINRYIYRIIPDQATIFLEVQAQGIDFSGLTPLQFMRQTQTSFFKKNFKKYRYPSFGYTYMGFNLKNKLFQDAAVRRAINYAIDKDEIIKGVLLGTGREITGPFVPESWAYNKDVIPAPFDPQLSKKLLKEALWQDTNGDGWLEKDGNTFEFTIITNQGNEQRRMCAELIQKRLAQVGIKVKIKILEWSSFISEFIDKRRFDAVLLGWSLSRDPDCYDIWHSSKTKEGEFNFIGYSNEEVDRLLIEGRRTFDQDKRRNIYHRIHELIYDEQPYIFLYVPDSLTAIHSRFEGIEVAPAGIGYNFIKWYVPEEKQRYIK